MGEEEEVSLQGRSAERDGKDEKERKGKHRGLWFAMKKVIKKNCRTRSYVKSRPQGIKRDKQQAASLSSGLFLWNVGVNNTIHKNHPYKTNK